MSYEAELANKQYQENVVIKLLGEYFAFHQPDSGLAIKKQFLGVVSSCVLNPTTVDARKPSTTISSYSFKIIDRFWCLSNLVQGTGAMLNGQQVQVFIGRVGVAMDFSQYKALPITRIKKQDYQDNAYTIATSEESDRIDKAIYQAKDSLLNDILVSATVIRARDNISDFPTSGKIRIGTEVISYTGVDLANNDYTGCIRGDLGTVIAEHSANDDILLFQQVQANPVDAILQLLISGSGVGNPYDVLQSGCAIDPSLIDIGGIEALRDSQFLGMQFKLNLYDVTSALKYMEDQILTPLRLRLLTSDNAKLTLRQMDRIAVLDNHEITDASIRSRPKWSVDDNRVINKLKISWDFNIATGKYTKSSEYTDAASVSAYGQKAAQVYSFKEIRADLGGQAILDDFAALLLNRLSQPMPEITLNTFIEKSSINVLDRLSLATSQLPALDGSVNFENEVEVISRGINHNTGDVSFKLAFTSGSLSRFCYISPSDLAQSGSTNSVIQVPAGRGNMYKAGWVMRLYDRVTRDYVPGAGVNTIASITGDAITFSAAWPISVIAGQYRIMFADYDEVFADQKRFCFISPGGGNFPDGKRTYVITL